ncbi:hypothetical protein Tco_0999658, partial [Tanacetum coccineum]
DSAGVGEGANIQPVTRATDTVAKDVVPLQPRRQRKRKTVVVDAGESSHPPKRLREDHGTPSGASVGGKSMSAVQRLLAKAVLNAEVGVAAIPTLPFVTSSVSTTLEHEVRDHTDFVVGDNVAEAEVDSLVRSSALIMTTVTTVTSTVDPALVAKEKPVKPSLFSADSSSAGGADPNTGVFSDLTGSDFLVGGIRTVIDPDTDLQKFFASVRGMEHDQLFTEFNVGAARQISLSVKVRDGEIEDLKAQLLLMETEAAEATRLCARTSSLKAVEKSLRDEVNALKEHNTILEKERNALDVKVTDLKASVVGKECDLTDLNAQLTSVKSQNDNLVDRVHELDISFAGLREKVTVYDNCMEQLEKFQDDQMKVVNDKLAKLDADLVDMACHLEERLYPHLLNMISGRRWLLTHGCRVVLQPALIMVDFPLLTELKSHKDASTEDIMNVLRLEGALADAPRMNDLQPDIEQLKLPIHRSEEQVVLGETSLSFTLSVSHSRMKQIRENIAAQRSALVGVWTPLSKPLSVTSLMGKASTFGMVPAASVTTTA